MALDDRETASGTIPRAKAVVIGLYGVPGSGKSTLLRDLKHKLGETQFTFYEGSEVIASLVPGGLSEFQQAPPEEKARWRQLAIQTIGIQTVNTGRAAIVTGHFMFWSEGDDVGQPVHTQGDLDTYSHIVYINTPPETVAVWRRLDNSRQQPPASVEHLRKWTQTEKAELRRLCRANGILFASLSDTKGTLDDIAAMLLDLREHTEKLNLAHARHRLDDFLNTCRRRGELHTALVLDADKTLAAEDTGALFWEVVAKSNARGGGFAAEDCSKSLQTLFGSPLGYTYTGFRQAMLLYEEHTGPDEFIAICEEVASSVTLHPEMLSLLRHAGGHSHVVVVVLTCGLRCVWEVVLAKAGLSGAVKVIGGGRISDGFVMTADVKGALVARMRVAHSLYVWAVGDGPLDLPMLGEAHQAIVVVGEERSRSKTMDKKLRDAIVTGGLRAHQVLLPGDTPTRLDRDKLPQMRLEDGEFLSAIARQRDSGHRILHAEGNNEVKLLTTATRDSRLLGPDLRKAHQRVGWYLVVRFLTDVVGLEAYHIPHVQGNTVSGHRIRHEKRTTIVALMRGGEPMAFGVSDALPSAMFLHAKQPDDVASHHVKGQWTVVLVDSVVNSGKSVVEFLQRIRSFDETIHIVVVAGVVQARSVLVDGILGRVLHQDKGLSLVALRLSENKFTGQGATDTGNRLFNSTQLD